MAGLAELLLRTGGKPWRGTIAEQAAHRRYTAQLEQYEEEREESRRRWEEEMRLKWATLGRMVSAGATEWAEHAEHAVQAEKAEKAEQAKLERDYRLEELELTTDPDYITEYSPKKQQEARDKLVREYEIKGLPRERMRVPPGLAGMLGRLGRGLVPQRRPVAPVRGPALPPDTQPFGPPRQTVPFPPPMPTGAALPGRAGVAPQASDAAKAILMNMPNYSTLQEFLTSVSDVGVDPSVMNEVFALAETYYRTRAPSEP